MSTRSVQGQSLPKYVQIAELMIRDIAAGRYVDGARLPPERELARSLGTTVTTLRKSLDLMEEKDLLKRVQGSGNYIQLRADVPSVYGFFRVELIEGGGLPTADMLDITRCEKPSDLPQFGSSSDAHRIRRLRRLNGLPCVLEEIWLDGSYAEHLSAEDLSESLYLHYREHLGLWITHAEDQLSISDCPAWAPGSFGVKTGQTCAYAQRLSFAQDGTCAEVSCNWIDPAVARYVARIK